MPTKQLLAPLHPGEILREEFLIPLGLTPSSLAQSLNLPETLIQSLINEQTSINPTLADALAQHFGTSAELWLGLQQDYELDCSLD